jgi:large subunit ribosomal protein L22
MKKNEIRAISKYVQTSPNKIRRVLRQIQEKKYSEALLLLKYMPYPSCTTIKKVICSAKANAKNNLGLRERDLIIKYAFANKGPTRKKVCPRAQGKAYQILKRTSHITIIME